MSPKIVLSLFIAFFMSITGSPVRAGDIISCDSFESCPDGSVPVNNAILALEARMDALEAAQVVYEASNGGSFIQTEVDAATLSALCGDNNGCSIRTCNADVPVCRDPHTLFYQSPNWIIMDSSGITLLSDVDADANSISNYSVINVFH